MIFNTTTTTTTSKFPIEMANNICKREISNTVDDTSAASKKQKQQIAAVHLSETDGSSIEITKRPRGRPPGSKNKPKPPVIITRESEPSSAMRPHVLEIPAGHDVIAALIAFSRRKNIGICILAGNGAVSNVTLRQPPHPATADPVAAAAVTATVGFGGRFEILSISATVMPPAVSAVYSSAVSVSLAGPQGQVIGGSVVGPLMAAGLVTVVAAGFENPTFHRLPAVDDDVSVSVSVSGDNNQNQNQNQSQQQQVEVQEDEADEEQEQEQQQHQHQHQQQQHYVQREYNQHPHHHQHHGVFGTHFTTDVMWPLNARPPHY